MLSVYLHAWMNTNMIAFLVQSFFLGVVFLYHQSQEIPTLTQDGGSRFLQSVCVVPQPYQVSWFRVCVGTSLLLSSPVSVSQLLCHLLTDSFSDCGPDLVPFFPSVTTWTSLRVAVAFVITHLRASLEMPGPPLEHTSPKDRDHACWLTLCDHHLPRLCRRTFG